MNTDVKEFLSLRNAIYKEKAGIESRLKVINEALGETGLNGTFSRSAATSPPAPRGKGHGRGRRNALSLKEAVLKVTQSSALTKQEILQAVEKLGYRFSTNDPLNSLGVILYGKSPRFHNVAGRFRPDK